METIYHGPQPIRNFRDCGYRGELYRSLTGGKINNKLELEAYGVSVLVKISYSIYQKVLEPRDIGGTNLIL